MSVHHVKPDPSLSTPCPATTSFRWFVITSSVIGGAGLAASTVPFLASLSPNESAHAQEAPVKISMQALLRDELRTFDRRRKSVLVQHRRPKMLASLNEHDDLLADSLSKQSEQLKCAIDGVRLNLIRDIPSQIHYAGKKNKLVRSYEHIAVTLTPECTQLQRPAR
ncbi:hypothetical protein D7I39_21655 [Allopusillimonas ginsengisoli]|nr:hypothetical protein D7I39_21655 [Allopusillimonas ginsengisoli]